MSYSTVIFDLDGTLIDTVYAHVFAWQQALAEANIPIEGWRIHRRIGMSGGLFINALMRETGRQITPEESVRLQQLHADAYARQAVQVRHAKPDPDLFLAAAERLGIPITSSVVVGDSVWDMLAAKRCRALGVGLLSGGYGIAELQQSGAYRVFEDPADLLLHIDEVGGRR
jgi:phosphoglycolate phosphatase-like HAD superfamily hydrolase